VTQPDEQSASAPGGQPAAPESRSSRWWFVLIVLLPWVLFHWMVPGIGERTLGNDYPVYTPTEQLGLLFSIRNGSFPLYAPGFWFGQSASALTLGQIFHPVAWVASLLPGY